jgi:hypothetical protein
VFQHARLTHAIEASARIRAYLLMMLLRHDY